MNEFKEFVLNKLEVLYLKLNYKSSYNLSTSKGLSERLEDLSKYEQLKEVVRGNPEWNDEEFSRELSKRIRKKTSI